MSSPCGLEYKSEIWGKFYLAHSLRGAVQTIMAHLLTPGGVSFALNQPVKTHCNTELTLQVVSIKEIISGKQE